MEKKIISQGKTKTIYETNNKEEVIICFNDKITAFNKKKEEFLVDKGLINKKISSILFKYLSKKNIRHHFIRDISDNEFLAIKLSMFSLEIVIRNIATGSLIKKLGIKDKTVIKNPISEIYYKNDDLNDPLINFNHIHFLNLASKENVDTMIKISHQVNTHLKELFNKLDLILVDFKLEFGKDLKEEIFLADEISPDSCRIWDKNYNVLDKDIFRKNLGDPLKGYQIILDKLNSLKDI